MTFWYNKGAMNLMVVALLLIQSRMRIQVMAIDFSAPVYQFTVLDADGKEVSLDKYRGKVLLIVNVASHCGLTNSNYHQMKILFDKYRSQGFEIAAFPCNQFAGQEPDDEILIKDFIKKTFDFEPDLYAKINVNGVDEHPLFTYLKHQQGGTIIDAIKWNFTKFLVNRHGRVVQRYAPTTQPIDIENDIRELLNDRSDL
uniref:Glutathione peroxidase n=1 Tax=Parascaris univalens TaxID=6257 RepID=A0A915C2I9_PARUN